MQNTNTTTFVSAPDGVDPAKVPFKKLQSGARLPCLGLGTFGNDRYDGDTIAAAVKDAITLGYRHIDCASVYGNEDRIGGAFTEVRKAGLDRKFFKRHALGTAIHRQQEDLVVLDHGGKHIRANHLVFSA